MKYVALVLVALALGGCSHMFHHDRGHHGDHHGDKYEHKY